MGTSKTEIFTAEQNQLAEWAKALAHPARIAILHHLLNSDSCVCGAIVQELGLAQATVSQHLKALKTAGLIKGRVEGTSVCYCIHPENWKQAQVALSSFFDQFIPVDCSPECC